MRTTLEIDDDILAAARSLGEQRRQSMGRVISDLARQALQPGRAPETRNGVPLLPFRPGSPPVTLERVNELRDGEDPRAEP